MIAVSKFHGEQRILFYLSRNRTCCRNSGFVRVRPAVFGWPARPGKGLPLCVRGRRRGLRDQSSQLARLGPSQVPGPPARLEYEPTELVPLGLCERGPAGLQQRLQQQLKLRSDPTMVGVRHSCRVNPAPDRPPGAREPARAGRPSPGSAPEPSSAAYAACRRSYSATPGRQLVQPRTNPLNRLLNQMGHPIPPHESSRPSRGQHAYPPPRAARNTARRQADPSRHVGFRCHALRR